MVLPAFVLSLGCDPAEPSEYLPVGGGDVIELDRGTFNSSDVNVLTVTTQDTSSSVCSGIAPFGCPGQESTALRTLVTLEAVGEGYAELRGITERGKELVLPYEVERIRAFEVRTLEPGTNEPGTPVPEGQELELATDTPLMLQINALGRSRVPLGYVEPFDVLVLDEALATVRHGRYSRGWRATVTGNATGSSSLRIVTEWATRELVLHVQ